MGKMFTELTREEIIREFINLSDPDCVGNNTVMLTFNLETPETAHEAFAIKLRNGVYYHGANLTWEYWDYDKPDLKWTEITREQFLMLLRDDLEKMSFDRLRMEFQRMRLTHHLVQENQKQEILLDKFYDALLKKIDETKENPSD